MPLDLVTDALGDPRNATALAVACDLAYLPETEGKAQFASELGLDAELISVENTQAYVATNDNHIVVAFRGTESPTSLEGLKDWLLTDAGNLLIVPEGRLGTDLAAAGVGAKFHQGFVNAIDKVWQAVSSRVEKSMNEKERPLWITGHSLGGALALLAAWLFQRKFVSVHQVYTFGGPMIGNSFAVKAFDKELEGKIFRYVADADPIPKLPTMSVMGNQFGHCEKEIGLGAAAANGSAVEMIQSFAGKTVDGIINATLIDEIWAGVKHRVDSHLMTNYRKLIQ